MSLTNKKPCVNNSKFTYSGKECSPLGKGYSADAEQIGTILEGRDSSMWMVGIKNGVKVWNRVPTDLASEAESVAKSPSPVSSPKKDKTASPKKKTQPKSKLKTKVSESETSDDEIEDKVKKTSTPTPTPTVTGRKVQIIDENDEEIETETKADEEEVEPEPVKLSKPPAKNSNSVKNKKTEETHEDKPEVKSKPGRMKKITDDSNVTEVKAPKASKGTKTDFNYFMSYQIEIFKNENPGMAHSEVFSKVATQWKKIPEDEKKAILEKAKAKVDNK